jgi:hypothetical protein
LCQCIYVKSAQGGAAWSVLFTKYYSGDQIKNEMSEACSTYGGEEEGFDGETCRKERLEDLGVDGRVILKMYLL